MIAGLIRTIDRPAIKRYGLQTGLLTAVVAGTVTACSSDSRTIAGPSPVKCALTATMASATIDAAGGTGGFSISTTPECTWTATADAPWVSGLSPASGQGSGQVEFRVDVNPQAAARETDIVVNNERVRVHQAAAACRVEVASPSSVDGAGGVVPLTVSAPAGCSWTIAVDASWITATPASGTGNGTVNLQIAANGGAARTGTVRVGDQSITITQTSGSCTIIIAPQSQNIAAGGGPGGPISVQASPECAWSAVSTASWLTVTSGGNGSGNGSVAFQVAPNAGSARTGTITIGSQTFVVNQAGNVSCTFTIGSSSYSIGTAGGVAPAVTVSTSASCSWNASSGVPWITILSGATGTGGGSVTYQVAANSGGARNGTLTIAGHLFSVSQEGGPTCSYAFTPRSDSIGSGGGGRSFTVETGASCSWTATSDVPWITITSQASGSGNGTIAYNVAANSGGERTGNIIVGGQTFTVTQTAPTSCNNTIAPTNQSVPAAGNSSLTVTVTANAGCTWSATSTVQWITVSSGTPGNGNGNVVLNVAANSGPARNGTVTIAGQTFSVSQAASCTFSISPPSQSIGASGGNAANVSVTTENGCSWTSSSNASWIKLSGQGSSGGTGSGSVNFAVESNSGPARSGTLTIAGQTHTVNQASGCSIGLAPTSAQIGAAGSTGLAFKVTAGPGCTWNASTTASWISLAPPAAGTGDGSVSYTVAANTGSARNGTITVGSQTFTVNQAGCSFTVTPPTQTSFTALGGTASVRVTASNSACIWQASSNSSWINIPPSGTGTGDVNFVVTPNTTLANRSGTITVAGQTFNITQAAAVDDCGYAILPTSQTMDESGGDGVTILVATELGCPWTAASNDGWITIESGQSGNGPGSVHFHVRSFNGNRREGTMTIAEHIFTVTQVSR
jgi:hypothetical protein